MGLWSRLAKSFGRIFGSSLTAPASWFVDWIRGETGESDSGVAINGKTALMYAPVWSSVNKIAGHLAMLPVHLHEQLDERTAVVANKHPAYRLMKTRPNSLMTAAVFKQTLQAHALLRGNGRAYIERNMRNDPAELIPLLPDRTVTVLVNGEKWHVVTNPETGEKDKLRDADVLHIPGLGFDGIVGYDLVEFAKNSLGLGLAAEKQASRHYKNNAVPSLVLEAPPGVFRKEDDAKEFLRKWNEYHQGLSESNKVGLLREGIKAHPLAVTAKDSDTVAQRLFQRQEAALWFQIEQILGDDSSVSYNSLEEKNKAYLTNCLMPWLTKWEQECDEKLLTGLQKRQASHFFKFQTAALLRGTTKERYDVYQIAIGTGILSPNEARQLEDLPPREGGDEYGNPYTTPGGQAANPPATDDEPADDDEPKPAEPPSDRARQLIASRLREIVKVEGSRAVESAKKPDKFLAWLDSFYSDDGFVPRLNAVIVECGGETSHTVAHCNQSREALLELSGNCGPSDLAAAVEMAVAAWGERAELLATILSERKDAA